MAKNSLTKHHEVCQNGRGFNGNKGLRGSNHQDNIIMLEKRKHEAFHHIFVNNDFRGQVATLLNINATSLSEDVKSDVIKILNCKELDYFFKKHCYKNSGK